MGGIPGVADAHFEYNRMCVTEMKASGFCNDVLKDDIVDEALVVAKALAAVEAFETGAYMESIIAVPNLTGDGWIIAATDYKSNWIEFGTHPDDPYKPMAARHILRRSLEALGYHPTERAKGS